MRVPQAYEMNYSLLELFRSRLPAAEVARFAC